MKIQNKNYSELETISDIPGGFQCGFLGNSLEILETLVCAGLHTKHCKENKVFNVTTKLMFLDKLCYLG